MLFEPELDYFQDFEWTDAQVQSKYEYLEALMSQNQEVNAETVGAMFNILKKAKDLGSKGLKAYAD